MSKYEDQDHEQSGYDFEKGRHRYIEEQKQKEKRQKALEWERFYAAQYRPNYREIMAKQKLERMREQKERIEKRQKKEKRKRLIKNSLALIIIVPFLFILILDILESLSFWVYLAIFVFIIIPTLFFAETSKQLSLKLQKPNQAWLFVSIYIGLLTLLFFTTNTYKLFTDSTENIYLLLIIFTTAILGWGILLLIDFISKKVTSNRVQLILKPRFISGYNNMFVNILLGSLKLILFIIMEHSILLTLALYVDSYF